MSNTLAAAEAWIGGFGFACLVLSLVWSWYVFQSCVVINCCKNLNTNPFPWIIVFWCLVFLLPSCNLQNGELLIMPEWSNTQFVLKRSGCCWCVVHVVLVFLLVFAICQNVCFAFILFLTEELFKTLTLFSKDQAHDAFSMLFWCFFCLSNLQDVFFVLLLILNWGAFQNTHFVFKRASSWCVLCVVLVFLCVLAIFKLFLCGHLLLAWGAFQNTHFVLKSSGSPVMWSSCCLSLLLSRPLFLVLIPFECSSFSLLLFLSSPLFYGSVELPRIMCWVFFP